MFIRNRIYRSPTEGGGGTDDKESGPEPVPYSVFKETNEKLRAAEAREATLAEKIDGYKDWTAPDAVESMIAEKVEAAKAETGLVVQMADAGVKPEYRSYMQNRLTTEGTDDVGSFLKSLKESEPAFFGLAPGKETPKTTPEGGKKPPATKEPGNDRAWDGEDVKAMSPEVYAEHRQKILAQVQGNRKP